MLKIENTERFIKDSKRYRLEIQNIDNPDFKKHAENLLRALEKQCKLISEAHNPSNTKSIDPRTARDSIKRSVDLRRELDKFIKDSKEC